MTSLSGEFALGSKPPSLTRIAQTGLKTRLISRHKKKNQNGQEIAENHQMRYELSKYKMDEITRGILSILD